MPRINLRRRRGEITLSEAARLLGAAVSTVYTWADADPDDPEAKRLRTATKKASRYRYTKRSWVEAFAERWGIELVEPAPKAGR